MAYGHTAEVDVDEFYTHWWTSPHCQTSIPATEALDEGRVEKSSGVCKLAFHILEIRNRLLVRLLGIGEMVVEN
jgi:hypothetical protein